jgi:putative transposase
MMYVRFPLSLRNVEDLLHERGVEISHETVRFWWHRFGPIFAAEIRKRRIEGMKSSHWRWHLGRDVREDQRRAALPLARRRSRGRGAGKLRHEDAGQEGRVEIPQESDEEARPVRSFVTDKLRSYGAAMKDLGARIVRRPAAG